MNDAIQALLLAAGRAPSGDNTQPWRFLVDPDARRVTIQLDETRDPSPMNAGQRMARIALGAAVENLLRAAEASGWSAEPEFGPDGDWATVRLSGGETGGTIAEPIAERVTNRRVYEGRPISADQLDRLVRETPPLDGVSTHWITDQTRLAALAHVIGQADATMFGDPIMRRAFLANVRFDEPAAAAVAEGLSLASLELSPADRLALRMMRRTPDWLLKVGGSKRVFASKAKRLVESASGLCLVVSRDGSPRTDLTVGRAMQRAWLALTASGLAAQPMMSLPVLDNALEHGDPGLISALGRDHVAALDQQFRSLAPELGDGRLAFLLRFGFAPAPSGRTARLPLDQITKAEPDRVAHEPRPL